MTSDPSEIQYFKVSSSTRPLFPRWGNDGIIGSLGLAKTLENIGAPSNQSTRTGRKEHPYDFDQAIRLKLFNEHHSTCIETKRDATVGLGFKEESVVDKLDSLTENGFEDLISDVCEDYWQVGNGYIEVVRDSKKIVGLHHCASPLPYKDVEDKGNFHWDIVGGDSVAERKFARFGDLEDFQNRLEIRDGVSELIAFARPTSLDPWYGYADWLGGISKIELAQALTQHEFDFFLNRGVPEFIAFFLGGSIDGETWKKVKDNFDAHIGYGKAFKSSAFHFPDPNLAIQIEKLGIEARQQGIFSEMTDTLATSIVSAHRVPPLLAGIQIPGKLGATNELPNALIAFQVLVIRQAQRSFQRLLGLTIGAELNISREQFEFKTILDEFPLDMMDTISRMRDPLGSGRDPSEGLKD